MSRMILAASWPAKPMKSIVWTRRAKPAGVLGAEVSVKVDGPPPVNPGELEFLAVDTRDAQQKRDKWHGRGKQH